MMDTERRLEGGDLVASVEDGDVAAQFAAIAGHVRSALALADKSGDALLGVKLIDCLDYVEAALKTLGA